VTFSFIHPVDQQGFDEQSSAMYGDQLCWLIIVTAQYQRSTGGAASGITVM